MRTTFDTSGHGSHGTHFMYSVLHLLSDTEPIAMYQILFFLLSHIELSL
jgi:hypothetical protein